MQKILELLQKAGVKPELATAITESLESYKIEIKEQFETDYTAKVNEAKKICVEEVESHKRELARRLQIFLETKSAAIDANLAKQSALSESEAVAKLQTVKTLIEGYGANGPVVNGQTTAALETAKRKIQQLNEEKTQAVAAANRQNVIAEKVLKRNRQLVSELAQLKSLRGNNGNQPSTQTVSEGRGNAPQRGSQRIDGSRRSVQPTSSRPTLVESQTRRPPAAPNQSQIRGGFGVGDIAENMDDEV